MGEIDLTLPNIGLNRVDTSVDNSHQHLVISNLRDWHIGVDLEHIRPSKPSK